MTETLTRSIDSVLKRESDRAAAYRALILDLAADKDVDVDHLDKVIVAARKTAADLASDLRTAKGRMALRAQLEAAEAASERVASLTAQIRTARDAAKVQTDAIEAELQTALNPFTIELHAAMELARQQHALQKELFQNCANTDLTSRFASLRGSLQQTEREFRQASELLHDAESLLGSASERGDADEVKTARARIEKHTATIATLEAKRAELVERSEAAFREMLTSAE